MFSGVCVGTVEGTGCKPAFGSVGPAEAPLGWSAKADFPAGYPGWLGGSPDFGTTDPDVSVVDNFATLDRHFSCWFLACWQACLASWASTF